MKDAKEKCFYYHLEGYWKRNYPKYLEELKAKKTQGNVPAKFLHVLKLNYVDNSTNSWIIDLEATNHVCSSLQMLNKTRRLEEKEFSVRVENGESVSAEAVGDAR